MKFMENHVLRLTNCGPQLEESARQQWCSIGVARDTRLVPEFFKTHIRALREITRGSTRKPLETKHPARRPDQITISFRFAICCFKIIERDLTDFFKL